MPRVVWTPVAESDLEEILYYLSYVDRNPRTGERIGREILERIAKQAESPQIGHSHPAAPRDWLYARHKRWLIFYRPNDDGIEIMRIVDAVRDLPRRLRGS